MRPRASHCCAANWAANGCCASPYAQYTEETQSELAIVRAAAEAHARYGPGCITTYIVSKCESVSDMLEVNLMLKEAGLYRPAEPAAAPIMVVPLFETIGDLQNAPEVMSAWFELPEIRKAAAAPRLSGSDGRLFGFEQGRRLSDLGWSLQSGHPRARPVFEEARSDADLPWPRRRGGRGGGSSFAPSAPSRRERCGAASASPNRAKSSPPSTARRESAAANLEAITAATLLASLEPASVSEDRRVARSPPPWTPSPRTPSAPIAGWSTRPMASRPSSAR